MFKLIVNLAVISLVVAQDSSKNRYNDPILNYIFSNGGYNNIDDLMVKSYQPTQDSKRNFLQDLEFYSEIELDASNPLTAVDFEQAQFLPDHDIVGNDSVLYSPQYFEGDIVEDLSDRNAIMDGDLRWPNGKIPYVLSTRFSERDRAVIARAMKTYHDKTCIEFVPRNTTDKDYIYIYPGLGCASLVGRVGRMQPVLLGRGCVYSGIVEHELMHATGFWHEQSRADRDSYVKINWDNIEKGMEYNFAKFTLKEVQHLGESYDYGSVMHYGTHAFSKGYGATISPLKDGVAIGQRRGLSTTDIKKINKLYNCDTRERLFQRS